MLQREGAPVGLFGSVRRGMNLRFPLEIGRIDLGNLGQPQRPVIID